MKSRAKKIEKELTVREIKRATEFLTLQNHRLRMVGYLAMKVEIEDWHGVADAAMDLREIDAKLSVYRLEMKS